MYPVDPGLLKEIIDDLLLIQSAARKMKNQRYADITWKIYSDSPSGIIWRTFLKTNTETGKPMLPGIRLVR